MRTQLESVDLRELSLEELEVIDDMGDRLWAFVEKYSHFQSVTILMSIVLGYLDLIDARIFDTKEGAWRVLLVKEKSENEDEVGF